MKRRLFIVTALGSLAAASGASPALARAVYAGDASATVEIRRSARAGAVPGGCSTFRRRSAFSGYTLADALATKFPARS
jgi:hypothetical protein